ncbi:CNP1-like family protein [Dechloromonas sp. ZY10]|uniref:CNP1-like family protein n=1 Tax=Dechloromonas aquae TaxID=2664436 RepID=UPI00352905ED
MKLRSLLGMLLCLALSPVWAEDDDDELKPWQELEASLPAFPKAEDLLPFVVSAATSNRFLVDARSLSVDGDGVVRYVLVVETAGGARNVTFEGMRCETRERRLYASGRADASWSLSRNRRWEPIRDAVANRHYAALFSEYFCPIGVQVRNAAEALTALRRGVHPLNERIGN